MYFAGLYLFFSGRHDKAREYIDRMLKMNSENADGLTLKGWIELGAGRESKTKNILQYFNTVLDR